MKKNLVDSPRIQSIGFKNGCPNGTQSMITPKFIFLSLVRAYLSPKISNLYERDSLIDWASLIYLDRVRTLQTSIFEDSYPAHASFLLPFTERRHSEKSEIRKLVHK